MTSYATAVFETGHFLRAASSRVLFAAVGDAVRRLRNRMSASGMFAILVASTLLLAACAFQCRAQSYPAKPVRIVVGFTSGTANDTIGRILAATFTESFGQQFLVDNIVGASGTIAGAAVAKAPPDGHTLLLGGTALAMSPYMFQRLPFDPSRDLAPIGLIATLPNVLVVSSNLKVRRPSLASWITQSQARAAAGT